MSEPVDLDGIEALADEAWRQSDRKAPLDLVGAARALVAEVRALRAKVADALETLEDLAHDNEVTGDGIRAHELTGPTRTLRAALSGERVS